MGLTYVVGIQSSARLWSSGSDPLPAKTWTGKGDLRRSCDAMRKTNPCRRSNWPYRSRRRLASGRLARRHERKTHLPLRRGSSPTCASRLLAFDAPCRRMAARRMARRRKQPTKYWLSTLPPDAPIATLVENAKLRWRIERDYQELKQELGLDHYEGRGWRGFHHHIALCVAAYEFLVSERISIPPSGSQTTILEASRLPNGYRPRGSADQTRTPRRLVNREHPLRLASALADNCSDVRVARKRPIYDTVRLVPITCIAVIVALVVVAAGVSPQ